MTTTGQRGKVAESRLNLEFKKLAAASSTFDFERIHDARSAKGAMSAPRAGDFCLYHNGKNTLIECKEVAHDYRLPCGNFGLDQRARMKKRQLAGTICRVVVYHSTTGIWRLEGLDYFGLQATGSWDLRGLPELTLKHIIEGLL